MDQITHNVRLSEWRHIIEQCQARPEGQSAKQWLLENGISDKRYYYWLRQVRQQAYDERVTDITSSPGVTGSAVPTSIAIAEIPAETILGDEPLPAITIQTRKSTIRISTAISESVMVELVKAVGHAL